jgi:hypothetical protein
MLYRYRQDPATTRLAHNFVVELAARQFWVRQQISGAL